MKTRFFPGIDVDLSPVHASTGSELEEAFITLDQQRAGALVPRLRGEVEIRG